MDQFQMVEINIIRVLEGKGINGKEAFDNIIFKTVPKVMTDIILQTSKWGAKELLAVDSC